MVAIKIIQATPGLTTSESILQLLQQHPEGMTLKQLSHSLNRPVSMLQICLKQLIASRQIREQLSHNQMQRLYFYVTQKPKVPKRTSTAK